MFTRLLAVMLLAMGLAFAAKSYSVQIPKDAWVGSTEVKAGNYKLELNGDKAILRQGKEMIEVPAKSETATRKYDNTSVDIGMVDGKQMLREIRLGGTTMMIKLMGN